jgi:hypothetical protein
MLLRVCGVLLLLLAAAAAAPRPGPARPANVKQYTFMMRVVSSGRCTPAVAQALDSALRSEMQRRGASNIRTRRGGCSMARGGGSASVSELTTCCCWLMAAAVCFDPMDIGPMKHGHNASSCCVQRAESTIILRLQLYTASGLPLDDSEQHVMLAFFVCLVTSLTAAAASIATRTLLQYLATRI